MNQLQNLCYGRLKIRAAAEAPFVRGTLRLVGAGLLAFLSATGFCGDVPAVTVSYQAFRFEPGETWRVTASGDAGATKLEGRAWHFDFTRGAAWVGLGLPDRSLFTRPERFRLRVRGEAKGHPVHVYLRTHFMTFHKIVGELTGSGEQELSFAAPPGEGWKWFGGENDGKVHGPFRLGEVRLEASGHADQGTLELLSFTVEGQCPSNKLCALTADLAATAQGEVFRAEARSLATGPLRGTLNWVLRNWDGGELQRGQRRLELPPGGEVLVADVPLPALPKSLRFAEAEFELKAPGQSIAPAQAYWLAAIPARENPRLQPESPFGMGVYLGRFDPDTREEVARKARDAGVKWSREDFSWGRIEPRPGEFHWDYYDQLLDCARRHGITVYAIAGYWTTWSKSYTTEGVEQYLAYVRQLVRRYKDRVKQWEIWNEPNIFFWQGPKEMYAELLKRSYAVIKAEDPSAQVLGLSTSGIDFGFIDKMLQLGAPFDVLTIHPYRKQFDDQAFINDLKKVSDLVKLPTGTRRPVWLTEMGWATHVPHPVLRQDFEPVTQRAQAELIARVYLCAIVSGVEPRTFWYDFRNDGADPFYFEHNMGILRQDGRPKPAYLAYATLAGVLSGLKCAGPVEAGAGNFAYRFVAERGGGREVIAVWNPKSATTAELQLPADHVMVINAVGEAHDAKTETAPDGQKARRLRLAIAARAPVYLVMEGSAKTGP